MVGKQATTEYSTYIYLPSFANTEFALAAACPGSHPLPPPPSPLPLPRPFPLPLPLGMSGCQDVLGVLYPRVPTHDAAVNFDFDSSKLKKIKLLRSTDLKSLSERCDGGQ